ncbi:MAG: hypothetical protein INQ03_01270 [Candidatus Heimdallarchaeota archaeon]|nr:hypothetical protein [Candidatus Heimdallarchaeota archaeon]
MSEMNNYPVVRMSPTITTNFSFLNEHGREIADIFTGIRIILILEIINLSIFFIQPYSLNTILIILLLAWVTDVLDGLFARQDRNKLSTWFGRNERKIDLILVAAAHLYLAQFIIINIYLYYIVGFLGFIAFVQMIKNGETELFYQMIYITIICGYIIIEAILINQYIWIPTIFFLIFLIIFNWENFKAKVIYFISGGSIRIE